MIPQATAGRERSAAREKSSSFWSTTKERPIMDRPPTKDMNLSVSVNSATPSSLAKMLPKSPA